MEADDGVAIFSDRSVESTNPFEYSNSNSSEQSKVSCSKFPIFYVDGFDENCMIQAVVLNYWDNICGPKIRNVWIVSKMPTSEEDCPRIDSLELESIGFIGRQILCGEMMRNPSESFLEAKFYHSTEKKMATAAVVFGADNKEGETDTHSLCLIPNYSQLQHFLLWKDVCFQWLAKCVLQLRITLANNATTGYTIVKEDLKRLVEITDKRNLCGEYRIEETLFSEMRGTKTMNLLHNSLLGYLCQGHQVVVVGTDLDAINKMLKTLLQFVLPQRRHRCRLLESKSSIFAPELHLQGLFMQSEKELESILKSVMFSLQPTCLIDLDTSEVFMICWCEEYNEARNKFIVAQLSRLWSERSKVQPVFSDVFKPVNVSKSMVSEFLNELSLLPNELKKLFISSFIKSLSRKALVLNQSLENLKHQAKKTVVATNQNETEMLSSILRSKLSLTSEWDAHVVSSFPHCLPSNCF